LDEDSQPETGFFVVGSWTKWSDPELMEDEGGGAYGLTIVIGENGREYFQIWIDADPRRVLHPGQAGATKQGVVRGPSASSESGTWLVDVRPQIPVAYQGVSPRDAGQLGALCRIRLRIAGKWRMVEWEKIGPGALEHSTVSSLASYYVVASWSSWAMEEMVLDESVPGLFGHEVQLPKDGGQFVILCNKDWRQAFFPAREEAWGEHANPVLGPGERYSERHHWCLGGLEGETFRIEFQRTPMFGIDERRISWRRIKAVCRV